MNIFRPYSNIIASTMRTLIDLPEEVLHHIFNYIPERDVFWSIGFCCLRLYEAVLSYIKHIELQLPSFVDDEYLARRGAALSIQDQDDFLKESKKMHYQNLESILGCQALLKSINYVAVGKIQNSIYKEEIIKENEQNHFQYCSELPSGSLSSKVLSENNLLQFAQVCFNSRLILQIK